MKLSQLVFLILVSIYLPLKAEVRQAPTMASALEGAERGTLVIFDLDNTVIMPPQTLGGEEWYDYFVEKRAEEFKKSGMSEAASKDKAIDQGLKEWNQFYQNAKVIPVEKETPALIAKIQSDGALTMALTGRPGTLAQPTYDQLRSVGISFEGHSVAAKSLTVPGKNPATFYKGLLLVGPKNNKGEVLVKFLKMLKLKPSKIIFVDNKQKHVDNVEKALVALNIPYFGRRHGAADEKISSMDKQVVEIQHRYFFGEVLSDSDAKKLVR